MQDVILSTFLALGLGAGGVAMAVFANDWVTVNTGARQIRDALAASAVSQAIYVCISPCDNIIDSRILSFHC